MDINTFKILHSETIEFCQIIEGDLKWIYSLMHVGDIGENHSKLEKTTLGQVVSMLKELDKSSGEQFISDGDYNFLKQMTEKRNYWCHVCYMDFMYEEDPLTSLAYKKVCEKLQRNHDRLEQVFKNVEKAKLKATEVFKREG